MHSLWCKNVRIISMASYLCNLKPGRQEWRRLLGALVTIKLRGSKKDIIKAAETAASNMTQALAKQLERAWHIGEESRQLHSAVLQDLVNAYRGKLLSRQSTRKLQYSAVEVLGNMALPIKQYFGEQVSC